MDPKTINKVDGKSIVEKFYEIIGIEG